MCTYLREYQNLVYCISKSLLVKKIWNSFEAHERCVFSQNKRITTVICTNMEISKVHILKDKEFAWMKLAENSSSQSGGWWVNITELPQELFPNDYTLSSLSLHFLFVICVCVWFFFFYHSVIPLTVEIKVSYAMKFPRIDISSCPCLVCNNLWKLYLIFLKWE